LTVGREAVGSWQLANNNIKKNGKTLRVGSWQIQKNAEGREQTRRGEPVCSPTFVVDKKKLAKAKAQKRKNTESWQLAKSEKGRISSSQLYHFINEQKNNGK
jgi:hypothetical protein